MLSKAVEVFVSYSRRDEDLLEKLSAHLKSLERKGVISSWNDQKITPGSEWEKDIELYLQRADIILILVSAEFLASDFCWHIEMREALKRHDEGKAIVVPVILRPVDWKYTPLGKLQALPEDAKAVISWPSQDEAFMNVAEGIQERARQVLKTRQNEENERKKKVAFKQYRQLLQRHIQDGEVSFVERQILKVEADSLSLSEAETSSIEDEELAAVRTYENNLEQYRHTFREVIRNESKLSNKTKAELKEYQESLQLDEQDVEREEGKILREWIGSTINEASKVTQLSANDSLETHVSNVEVVSYPSSAIATRFKNAYKFRRLKQYSTWLIFFLVTVSLGVFGTAVMRDTPGGNRLLAGNKEVTIANSGEVLGRFSSGEHNLLTYKTNPNLKEGNKAFASQDYARAYNFFAKAIKDDRNAPEAQIYLNNTQARLAGSPMILAVVVPVDGAAASAEEMLRGVADAQTEFNKAEGLDGKLLEIIIVNDGNEPSISSKVANELVKKQGILGVIGHNSSSASEAALPVYEKADLAMISPTSTSIYLSSKVFFRTVPSDEIAGATLAKHAFDSGLRKLAIFYNPESNYSLSIQKALSTQFEQLGGSVFSVVNMGSTQFTPDSEVQNLQDQVDGIALLPNKDFVPVALSIARANAALASELRINLLGGDAMYSSKTLKSGANAVEGLTLSVPWFAQTPYAVRAEERWGGQVSWRTATSYDATRAFIQALSENPSPKTILENLGSISIPSEETSGDILRFSVAGERVMDSRLVQVIKDSEEPTGSSFVFQLVK